MTRRDEQFLKEMGIECCHLDDPFPSSLPPPPPPGPVIPALLEKDARWLLDLGVLWEEDAEPGFVPPKSLREYLARYPNGMRRAVGEAAKRLGLDLSDDDMDDMAQDLIVMFLDFAATGLEDIFDMYPFRPPMRPWGCRSAQFREYVTLRVMAGMLAMLHANPAGMDDFGECLGY
ncbi:MAG: hypothetical protein ABSH01_14795 [Terriglobia bacterium]|jgi:hypothetical protein